MRPSTISVPLNRMWHLVKSLLVLALLAGIAQSGQAQNSFYQYPDTLNKKRLRGLVIAESATYATTMYGLYTLWYRDFPKSDFHWFNDNRQWLQMDKIGHAMTSYEIGRFGIEALKWSGVEDNKALWYGGLLGFVYQGTIEVFDGFSAEWGASSGDILANGAGTALVMTQEALWHEQRAQLKVSAHLTSYAQYRPETLGSTIPERLFKDYNGQTYWLSVSPSAWLPEDSKFPKWLAISGGYSADGMLGGTRNPITNSAGDRLPPIARSRQYLLSLDVDFTRLKTRSKFLNTVMSTFGFVKVPFPALQWSPETGLRGYALYF